MTTSPRTTTTGRREFWPLRDLPVLLWLIAAVVVALAHPFLPAPRWLMIHLVLLGAVSHAILVWSRYFADALLHQHADDRRGQTARLALLNGGVVAVVAGVLSGWWPGTVIGACAVAGAVLWHGWVIARMVRAALQARFGRTVRYYVAAACFLPLGAVLGTLLARDLAEPWHTRVVVAHATVNLLGWVGLTVAGTLVTLWPTILRTKIAEGVERAAARALPVLVIAVLGTAAAALAGSPRLTALGLAAYLAGLALLGPAFVEELRRKPPAAFAPWSVLAGVVWLVGCLTGLAVGIGRAGSWSEAGAAFAWFAPYLAAGFGLQVLLGALAYLLPVKLGGGPRRVRAANAIMDRGWPLRIAVTNAGLVVCVLPVPSVVRVIASVLVLAALLSWLVLLVLALRAGHRPDQPEQPDQPADRPARPARSARPAGQAAGLGAAGLALVVLAVAAGVAVDPAAAGAGSGAAASAGVSATGQVTTVEVIAKGMRFSPSTITVPAGNRLVIHLTNAGDDVHDLVLDSGVQSGRLAPGASATLDVGVVGRAIEGWCSVLGHRQMGMVLHIQITGPALSPTEPAASPDSDGHHGTDGHGSAVEPGAGAAADLDPMAPPPASFRARDAALPAADRSRVHRRTLTIRDVVTEVAPGVRQRLWTYDGTVPGPVLHGRVGDEFVITLVNRGTVGHSIDFHASAVAPQGPMRTIAPGESLVYRFRAQRAGIWMYHCSTMPMAAHVANGLFGAVIIEPPDLPAVDRSYVLVQSELYLGAQDGPVDVAKLTAERPDGVVFNGYVNQYDHRPLPAKVGERVRVWVLDAGPNRPTSFHVIGGQFDTAYAEGAYLLKGGPGGSQALGLQPAQGGFVELTFPQPGDYPFVSHLMVDAERGAHGLFRVSE